jgi:hypothetical protein
MKKYTALIVIIINTLFIGSLNAVDYSKPKVTTALQKEFRIPLTTYLSLLAEGADFIYTPSEGDSACDPIKVPFHTRSHSLLSNGELITIYDHLEQLALIIPTTYHLEIHHPDKIFRLTCAA